MRRLGVVVLLALTLGVASLAATAAPMGVLKVDDAQAGYYYPTLPQVNPLRWGDTWRLITGQVTRIAMSPAAEKALLAARVAAGMVTATELALAASALGAGFVIGTGIDRYFHISCAISSTCQGASQGGATNYATPPSGAMWSNTLQSSPGSGTALCGGTTGYMCGVVRVVPQSNLTCFQATAGDVSRLPSGGTDPCRDSAVAYFANFTGLPGAFFTDAAGNCPPKTGSTSGCTVWRATPLQVAGSLQVNVPDVAKGTRTGTAITPSLAIPTYGGGTQTAVSALLAPPYVTDDEAEEIGEAIDEGADLVPDTIPDVIEEQATIPIPPPDPGEDANSYRRRLVAAGVLGAITIITLAAGDSPHPDHPDYDPRYGPDSPVKIKVGDPLGAAIPLPAPGFPSGAPDPETPEVPDLDTPTTVRPHDPVQITKNPTTVDEGTGPVPVPPPPGGGGGGTCTTVELTPLDASPLTELDYGGSFPFGVFGWFEGVLEDLTPGRVAPSFTFAGATIGGYELPDYTIDLSWADSYMSTIRTMIAFSLIAMAVWYFATGFLGLRGGVGDPGGGHDVGGSWD